MSARIRIRYNEAFGLFEVVCRGQIVYQSMDEDDAREWAACNVEG